MSHHVTVNNRQLAEMFVAMLLMPERMKVRGDLSGFAAEAADLMAGYLSGRVVDTVESNGEQLHGIETMNLPAWEQFTPISHEQMLQGPASSAIEDEAERISFLCDVRTALLRDGDEYKTFPFTMKSQGPEAGEDISCVWRVNDMGVFLSMKGYSDYSSEDDLGVPVWLENYDGHVVIRMNQDINREDFTFASRLDGARNDHRKV